MWFYLQGKGKYGVKIIDCKRESRIRESQRPPVANGNKYGRELDQLPASQILQQCVKHKTTKIEAEHTFFHHTFTPRADSAK